MNLGRFEVRLSRARFGYRSEWNYGSTSRYRYVNLGRVNVAWRRRIREGEYVMKRPFQWRWQSRADSLSPWCIGGSYKTADARDRGIEKQRLPFLLLIQVELRDSPSEPWRKWKSE
jgi:hypothetical protein